MLPPDGRTRSTRVRGPTLGKGVQKKIARKKGEKLHVYVNQVLNAITGGNATPATNELGLQIRRLCPLQSVKSWRKIYRSTKDAVVQAVLDKFVIGDDFDNDEQAQLILDRKAYLLYKDWRYNLKQEFLELEEQGVNDPYSHSPIGANEDGEIDFLEFYKKSHKSKMTGDWIDPKCSKLHDEMVNLQVVAIDAGMPLTHEELSRKVLGPKKNYLRGCGIGPQPSSTANSATQARDKHMESMRAELEVLHEERQRDHEELLKEKEERRRDHEEIMREREEMMKQVKKEKRVREA
ncbi:hypothetical protein ACSBR2_002670 [Camellia fascicularis]